jgi:hypothetical protein
MTKKPDTANPNMDVWDALARPPKSALKTIKGGRLQGMTDVNPQWRYQAMTARFGPIGVGWKFDITKVWTEPGTDGEVLAFAQIAVRVRVGETWSEPIIGIGGNHLVVKESKGLRNNDECYKMAVTDALSVALKMLGVAADIYAGLWDGSKYLSGPAEDRAVMQATAKPDKEVRAARKARGALPEGIVYIEKVVPRSKGNFEWAEIITSDGEPLILFEPGAIALAINLAQEDAPVEIAKHRNAKGNWQIDELARWRPAGAQEPVGAALSADDIAF